MTKPGMSHCSRMGITLVRSSIDDWGSWECCCSICVNHLHYLKTSRVKALAEIFDFLAGLVQRVPKKLNEMKADLQNSTARLWNLEGSATGDEYDGEIDVVGRVFYCGPLW